MHVTIKLGNGQRTKFWSEEETPEDLYGRTLGAAIRDLCGDLMIGSLRKFITWYTDLENQVLRNLGWIGWWGIQWKAYFDSLGWKEYGQKEKKNMGGCSLMLTLDNLEIKKSYCFWGKCSKMSDCFVI